MSNDIPFLGFVICCQLTFLINLRRFAEAILVHCLSRQGILDQVNADLPSYSTIKKFALVPAEFEAGEELTPSLKVKRRVVEKKYANYLDELYR